MISYIERKAASLVETEDLFCTYNLVVILASLELDMYVNKN